MPEAQSIESLFAFLTGSPSPYHAVASAAATLDAAGFVAFDEAEPWDGVAGGGYVARGGALVAWRVPAALPSHAPFRIVGAHTDSPNLRVKPRADTGSAGWRQLAVEVYGGVLLNSWLDRDLGLSGRLVLDDGRVVLVHVDQPLARVPQLAIHLDRDVNERGLALDKQVHLTPIWGLGAPVEGQLAEFLAGQVPDLDPEGIAAWDLMLHDLTPPARPGPSRRAHRLGAARQPVLGVGRHHGAGIGSRCRRPHRLWWPSSTTRRSDREARPVPPARCWRPCSTVSCWPEGGRPRTAIGPSRPPRACRPTWPTPSTPTTPSVTSPATGPCPTRDRSLKVNANQRYASDAVTEALFTRACRAAGVPWQVFVSRNSMPCGSTIGPLTATRLGIATVDVGCAQLSMHSARELCGAEDPELLAAALGAYLAGA